MDGMPDLRTGDDGADAGTDRRIGGSPDDTKGRTGQKWVPPGPSVAGRSPAGRNGYLQQEVAVVCVGAGGAAVGIRTAASGASSPMKMISSR